MKDEQPALTFREARTGNDYENAAALFKAYAGTLDIDLGFQDFDNELKNIRSEYGRPHGVIIIALKNEKEYIGCAGVRKFEGSICELKRMYVVKAARGEGIGKALLQKAVEAARALGYAKMRLDTLPAMQRAIQLYEKEGFYEIAPYRYNPVAGTRYYEKELKRYHTVK
ncbi:MAG: GNAT family N-acetyltransferase [Sinomicrobium sp.]|nr:GNAT family N-acetyltransferase [Sinomicrobium sp.]